MGMFASAAGGRRSEQKGVAAVEKNREPKGAKIFSETATGHNGVSRRKTSTVEQNQFQNKYGELSKWS